MPHERITESEILYRDFTIDPGTVDEAQRTVQFSFSSETPVERDFGMEILDHGPSSVRLGRLRAGAVTHGPRYSRPGWGYRPGGSGIG